MDELIEIDGSSGEGGGQVLRTSLSLSAVTERPTRIRHIRAGRSNPGLAPQHLTVLRALARICDARLHGDEIGSTEVLFEPGSKPVAGQYVFDVAEARKGGTAGSATLIFQALLIPLALAREESLLVVRGGTHVPWSPSFEAIDGVFLPAVRMMGLDADCRLDERGFYPAGGGQLTAIVRPMAPGKRVEPLVMLERGPLVSIRGTAIASNLPAHIPQRMANRARNLLNESGMPNDILPARVRGAGPGAGLFIVAEYEGGRASFSAIGERGKRAETVAEEACRDLLAHHGSNRPVDMHLADQLLLPMALAGGPSRIVTCRTTSHQRTNADIIGRFLPVRIDFEAVEGKGGGIYVVPFGVGI